MDKPLATEMMRAVLAVCQALGGVDQAVSSIPDEAERRLWAKRLGSVVHANNDLIDEIVRDYPELEPYPD